MLLPRKNEDARRVFRLLTPQQLHNRLKVVKRELEKLYIRKRSAPTTQIVNLIARSERHRSLLVNELKEREDVRDRSTRG